MSYSDFPADVPASEVQATIAAVKAEYQSLVNDAREQAIKISDEAQAAAEAAAAEISELHALVEKHATEVIRLYGVISEGVTKEIRLHASHWLDSLRTWADAVKDAVS